MWVALTESDVRARIAREELDAYLDAGGNDDAGGDTMATIIAQVTAMVRGRVAACRDNSGLIGPAGTIPDEALFAAATIARDALIGSLPLSEGVSEVRKEELRKAHEFLTAISTCAVSIDATGAESSGPSICGSYGGYPYLHF